MAVLSFALTTPLNLLVDLAHGEAGRLKVKVEVEFGESFEVSSEHGPVPRRVFRQAVVGNSEGARLSRGQALQANDGDVISAKIAAGHQAPVAGEHLADPVNEDGHVEVEGSYTRRDLFDLRRCVQAGILSIESERLDRALFNAQPR